MIANPTPPKNVNAAITNNKIAPLRKSGALFRASSRLSCAIFFSNRAKSSLMILGSIAGINSWLQIGHMVFSYGPSIGCPHSGHLKVITALIKSCSSYSHGQPLSNPLTNTFRVMKNFINVKVILEPELQEEVELLNSWQRLRMARKFERWAHQLRISAFILSRNQTPKPRSSLKALPRRRLFLN